jgi:hypothetical protein
LRLLLLLAATALCVTATLTGEYDEDAQTLDQAEAEFLELKALMEKRMALLEARVANSKFLSVFELLLFCLCARVLSLLSREARLPFCCRLTRYYCCWCRQAPLVFYFCNYHFCYVLLFDPPPCL